MNKGKRIFDTVVLAGLVVNILFAVFMLLYYFDLL
tara:strand:- start:1089 stop:1193 length:105 start_codon:yes stop_codon:yes gene_type:complete